MSKKTNAGFTIVELMVATVLGLATVSSAYAIGASLTRQFHEQSRIATTQGSMRFAIEELKRDITRAGLFHTPRANTVFMRNSLCPQTSLTLPTPAAGTTPMGAIQYFEGTDAIVDISGENSGIRADTLRLLGNMVTDSKFTLSGAVPGSADLSFDILDHGFQDTFRKRPYSETTPGIPDLNALFTSVWTNTLVHIRTANQPYHIFATATTSGQDVAGNYFVRLSSVIPTNCLDGDLRGATISPVSFIEYRVVNPTDGSSDLDLDGITPTDNRVLVRRMISTANQALLNNAVSVIAEYVVNFQVSFYMSDNDYPNMTGLDFVTGEDAENAVAANPQRVRAAVIDLWVRTAREDPRLPFVAPTGTNEIDTFDVNKDIPGSARVRKVRFQVPMPNNLRVSL